MHSGSDVGRRLQQAPVSTRKAKGVVPADARREGSSLRATVQNIETGGTSPSVAIVERLAVALQVPIASVLAEDGRGAYPGWSVLQDAEQALVIAVVHSFAAQRQEGRTA